MRRDLTFSSASAACYFVILNLVVSLRGVSWFAATTEENNAAVVHRVTSNSNNSVSNTTLPRLQSDRRRRFMRYDEAGRILHPLVARSHWLPSIPATRQIPTTQAEDLNYHVLQRKNTSHNKLEAVPGSRGGIKRPRSKYNISTDFRTIYLYNPSIVPADVSLGLQESFHDDSIEYIASFRGYLGSNCFGPSQRREIMGAGEQVNYLGVALLNRQLDVVRDIVVDINDGPLPGGAPYWERFRQPVEDCRIFNVNTTLHLVCNAILFKVRLQPTSAAAATTTSDAFHIYPNLYGNAFELALLEEPILLVTGKVAKNMNIFRHRGAYKHDDEYYLQIYPQPHWYRNLRDVNNSKASTKAEGEFDLPKPSFDTPDVQHTILASARDLGRGQNQTVDDQPFFPDDRDRGTACCIEVQFRYNKTVLVGISHTKLSGGTDRYWTKDQLGRYENATYTYGWNRYVSRFLAYESQPPFSIVARSGWFCLPFADENNEAGGNTMAGKNSHARLDLFDDSFACPAIHFPSSISETARDSTKAIIGYGINDCYPRMILVEKRDIAQLLDPSIQTH